MIYILIEPFRVSRLAKLYSQLRHEHLELLQKFKGVQLKAASAQEAIDRREKLERELKTKNLELADMIRERDRALHDKVIRVIHGENDIICSPARARAFVDELREAGTDATFTGVPGGGHAMLDKPWRWHVRAARAVKEIVDSGQVHRG